MSVFDYFRPAKMPDPNRALPGRNDPIEKPGTHSVLGTPLAGPWPDGTRTAVFAFGCFWGAEKDYWERPGVISTAVGYVGRLHPEPDLSRGMHRPDRPRRGRAASPTTRRGSATRSC